MINVFLSYKRSFDFSDTKDSYNEFLFYPFSNVIMLILLSYKSEEIYLLCPKLICQKIYHTRKLYSIVTRDIANYFFLLFLIIKWKIWQTK